MSLQSLALDLRSTGVSPTEFEVCFFGDGLHVRRGLRSMHVPGSGGFVFRVALDAVPLIPSFVESCIRDIS